MPLIPVELRDADGRVVGTELRERRSLVGTLEGGVQALGHELGFHPFELRRAIANHTIEATFRGGGRYEIGAAEVERIRDQGLVRAPAEEPGPACSMYPTGGE